MLKVRGGESAVPFRLLDLMNILSSFVKPLQHRLWRSLPFFFRSQPSPLYPPQKSLRCAFGMACSMQAAAQFHHQ